MDSPFIIPYLSVKNCCLTLRVLATLGRPGTPNCKPLQLLSCGNSDIDFLLTQYLVRGGCAVISSQSLLHRES
jgi:hypothetical protein